MQTGELSDQTLVETLTGQGGTNICGEVRLGAALVKVSLESAAGHVKFIYAALFSNEALKALYMRENITMIQKIKHRKTNQMTLIILVGLLVRAGSNPIFLIS
ncbi:hypothetical protein AMECASPLE_031639 [Ameca splendens]|uniref:Uncharacterized protein n=1 Tax=Ameca splendens TaxID=208324 RepID=A0ABV1ACR7_9TELE